MRLRLPGLAVFGFSWLIAGVLAVHGQDETPGNDSTLRFDAGGKEFIKRPDGTFLNRYFGGVRTHHRGAILEAEEGVYDSRSGEVRFYGAAAFRDSVRTLFADTLLYYEHTREAFAVGNVRVLEGKKSLAADSVFYRTEERFLMASGAVSIHDDSTRTAIRCVTAEFDDPAGYGRLAGGPYLARMDEDGGVMTAACRDTLELFENDRLIRMWRDVTATMDSMTLSCDDTLEINDAERTVTLWGNVVATKDSLTALSPYALYDESAEVLMLTGNPEIRYVVRDEREEAPSRLRTVSVVRGDTIRVMMSGDAVTGAEVTGSAVSTTTSVDTTGTLFDRSVVESRRMALKMEDGYISLISAEGTARSYYHRNYAGEKRMFVNEASGDTLTFYFDRGALKEMKIFGFGGGLGKGKYYEYEEGEPLVPGDGAETPGVR